MHVGVDESRGDQPPAGVHLLGPSGQHLELGVGPHRDDGVAVAQNAAF
jgi:hypothetical protein